MIQGQSLAPGADLSAPVVLRVLGAIDLRRDGVELPSVLSQPRRLALLVYLVLARAGGYRRRDELVGLFWPESTGERARAALRQAVHFLRRELGDGVVTGRGSEELGTGTGMLACDAVAFRLALDAGDDARAVAIYRGELLPGFFVSDAPALEQWIEQERSWHRTAAREAARRLATAASGEAAVALWRRAMEIDPLDEPIARQLIEALDASGNRAAALAAFDAFAERLRRELDIDPSSDTMALVESLRAAPAHPRADTTASARNVRRVVVTAFDNETGRPDLDALGRMAADWVARGLAEVPDLEVVPPIVALGGPPRTRLDLDVLEHARTVAEHTGAGTVVSGAYYVLGEEIGFQSRIIDAASGRMLRAPDPVVAPVTSPVLAVEALRQQLTGYLAPVLGARESHLGSTARPPSYEAYRSYMDGLERFVAGDWRDALGHFEHSAELEPSFVLPRIVCAIAHWNLCELERAQAVVDAARRFRSSAGTFERAVLDMVTAWLRGDWGAAQDAARRQAALAPGSIPHFQVAEEARRLNRPREALSVLSRLDPQRGELRGLVFYWLELGIAHHLLGDHARELEVARQARALHPHDPKAMLIAIRARAAQCDMAGVSELIDESLASSRQAEPRPGALMHEAALELAAHGAPAAAAELLERCVGWYRSPPVKEVAGQGHRRALARTLYLAGRWDEAEALFRGLEREGMRDPCSIAFHHGHLQGHLDQGYLAVLAVRRGDHGEVDRRCRELEQMERPFLYGSQRLWLAAVAALRGDRAGAVASLRKAFAEGLPLEMFVHTEPHLLTLRGYAPFDTLLAPRG